MRVLVCGGRDYLDFDHVWSTLGELDDQCGPFDVVFHGCATGVDTEAERWAGACRRRACGFRADWFRYGNKAGPVRNQRMLDEGRPDLVVAFPGGRGTADMVKRARKAGLRVIEVKAVRP